MSTAVGLKGQPGPNAILGVQNLLSILLHTIRLIIRKTFNTNAFSVNVGFIHCYTLITQASNFMGQIWGEKKWKVLARVSGAKWAFMLIIMEPQWLDLVQFWCIWTCWLK